jgi:uncharacterized metal-binding protein YceD (DUF177 family)
MFTFKINEIPQGRSTESVSFSNKELDFDDPVIKSGIADVVFERKLDRIKVDFIAKVMLDLECDRSLDHFDFPLEVSYTVVFDASVEEDEDQTDAALRHLDLATNKINIQKEVRDSLLLEIPIKKLHPRFYDEDGIEIPFTETFSSGEEIDDRWEALKKLK